jgi:hypothetical protein
MALTGMLKVHMEYMCQLEAGNGGAVSDTECKGVQAVLQGPKTMTKQ